METFQNEIVSFSIITIVILMLAYFTKKKEESYKQDDMNISKSEKEN